MSKIIGSRIIFGLLPEFLLRPLLPEAVKTRLGVYWRVKWSVILPNIYHMAEKNSDQGANGHRILSALLKRTTRPKQASLNSLHAVFDFFANISFQTISKNTNNKKTNTIQQQNKEDR